MEGYAPHFHFAELSLRLIAARGRSALTFVPGAVAVWEHWPSLLRTSMTWRSIDVAIANWRRKASVLEKPELAEIAT